MNFLLVDRIVSLQPGVNIVAAHDVGADEDYFGDHFPGFPVVPGVLLTEMMGQAAAKCLIAERNDRGKPILAKIQDATFRQWVLPGQSIELRATITASQSRFSQADCESSVLGTVVATAKLMFAFAPGDPFLPNPRDDVLERFLAKGPT
mgnify:CR=1 FL=1